MGFSCYSRKVFVLKKSSKWHFYLGDIQLISFRRNSEQFTSFAVYVHWNTLTKYVILIVTCHIRNSSKQVLWAFHFNDYKADSASPKHYSKACFLIMKMVPFPFTDSTSPNEKKSHVRARLWAIDDCNWFFLEQLDFWVFF